MVQALESRVRDWRKKIEPALEAEEARKPFNIHEYGEQVKVRLAQVLLCVCVCVFVWRSGSPCAVALV